MVTYKDQKTNFVAGEFDPALRGRSDVKYYYNAASLMRNVEVLPQGGARTRPGSRFVWEVPEVSPGVPSNVRLVDFQFNTEQAYIIAFSHLRADVFRNDVHQATITTPFTSDDLIADVSANGAMNSSGISWTQSRDSLLVFHEDHPTQLIQRGAGHTIWTIQDYPYKNLPEVQFAGTTYVGTDEVQTVTFPDIGGDVAWVEGDTYTLFLEGEETTNIQYSNTAATHAARIQAALRDLPNTSATGINVTVTIDDASGETYTVTFTGEDGERPWGVMAAVIKSSEKLPITENLVVTKGEIGGEPVFSAARGYPRCGTFYQGRLWVGGTSQLPNTLWASRAGDVTDFNNKRASVDYGFQVTSDTDDVPAILRIFPGRHLQIFTTSAEFYVPVSDREAVTPENIVLRRNTSLGAKPGVSLFEVDGATIFVQRLGASLREFLFTDSELAYQANPLSLLSAHLIKDPVAMGLQKALRSNNADRLFLVNDDGTMTVLCTLRTQEVNAFVQWSTEGEWKDVRALLDTVYAICHRTIDGATKVFLERFEADLATDCAVTGGPGATGTAAHLGNSTVDILLDDGIQQQQDLVAGVATFLRNADNDHEIGLPWPDVHADYPGLKWIIRTLSPNTQLPDGAMGGRRMKIGDVDILVTDTTGMKINDNRVAFRRFGASLLDQPIDPFAGRKHVRTILGWSRDGYLVFGDTVPTRATILQLTYTVRVS